MIEQAEIAADSSVNNPGLLPKRSMKIFCKRTLSSCVLALLFCCGCYAQSGSTASPANENSTASNVLSGTGRVAVIVVGSAAKATWVTTKFAAKHVAKPVAVKIAPHAAGFVLKKTAIYLLPIAIKLSLL